MKGKTPILPLLAGFGLALPSLFAPSILWEWRNHGAGQSVAASGMPYLESLKGLLLMHPPSMAYVVGWSIRIFGDHVWAWRLPGLCMLLASGILVWSLILEMGGTRSTAWLACALFLTNPLVIQVALGIDFADGSVLTLGVALFFWTLFRRRPWSTALRSFLLGLCLCLCLWSKLATAFLLMCSFSLACWLGTGAAAKRRLWVGTLGAGGLFFLGTWGLFCSWLNARAGAQASSTAALMWEPFAYLTGSGAATDAWTEGISQWALYEFSFAAYAGVLLLAVAAAQGGRWARRAWVSRRLPEHSIVPLFALACLTLYGVFLGGGRAYPKYFQTLMISVAVLASQLLTEDDRALRDIFTWSGAGTLAFMTFYYAFVVGDYLYTLNFNLRNSSFLGNPRPAELRLAAQGALYLAPVAVVLAARKALKARYSTPTALALVLLGSQLGLDLAQLRGGYDLRQAYGASQRDFIETAQAVRGWAVPGPVLADRGVVDAADAVLVKGYGSSSWRDLDEISTLIATERPKAVVYGISLNTVDELRAIGSHERLRSLLSSDYTLRKIGSFTIWLRKPDDRP